MNLHNPISFSRRNWTKYPVLLTFQQKQSLPRVNFSISPSNSLVFASLLCTLNYINFSPLSSKIRIHFPNYRPMNSPSYADSAHVSTRHFQRLCRETTTASVPVHIDHTDNYLPRPSMHTSIIFTTVDTIADRPVCIYKCYKVVSGLEHRKGLYIVNI